MGFRLNHLAYEETPSGAPPAASDVSIEIRCGKQNIVSRLSATEDSCSCPARKDETENEASFWEILGTAPSSSPGGKKRIEDASSNLLPELSQRGVSNTKQLLKLIFDGFHKDHLPSTTTNSPEARPELPRNPIHTSTQIKSPRRLIPVLNSDMLLQVDEMSVSGDSIGHSLIIQFHSILIGRSIQRAIESGCINRPTKYPQSRRIRKVELRTKYSSPRPLGLLGSDGSQRATGKSAAGDEIQHCGRAKQPSWPCTGSVIAQDLRRDGTSGRS